MVVKKNGSPRWTVDFKAVNNAAPRQTHPVILPFQQAASVPPGTYKTCLDAWEGYHSIPIEETDRYITTFVTPFGRFRYKVLPQGFLAANDAYCERYDKITRGCRI